MDVRLSDEQRALREAAAQLVDRLGPKSVAELDDGDRRGRLESALGATGWRELRCGADDVPDGDPMASTIEVALVAEELGRGLADAAFTGATLAAELRRLAGAAPASGSETVLVTDDLAQIADRAASALAVDGSASSCLYVDRADHRVVAVEPGPATAEVLAPVDLTRGFTVVAADPDSPAVGGIAAVDLTRWTAFGLAIACADLVGVMRGTLELARSYACTRQQYGAAIGSFQAVQHLLADAHVALEGSRSTALHAAWAVDALDPAEALAAAAGAKAFCARAAMAVCETSIQVHGGIGNTWECLAHVYLRRALVSADLLGNVGPNLQRVLDHRLGAA